MLVSNKKSVELSYTHVFLWMSVIFLYGMLLNAYNNPNSFPLNAFLIVYIGTLLVSLCLFGLVSKSLHAFGIDSSVCNSILMGLTCVIALKLLSPILLNNPELYYITAFKNYSVYTREATDIIFCIFFFCLGYFLIPKRLSAFVTVFTVLNLYNAAALGLYHFHQNRFEYNSNTVSSVKIKDKKNVYFILVDSLVNVDALKDLGIFKDIESDIRKLKLQHFKIYDHFHTSLQPTKYALYTYLDMDYQKNGQLGYFLGENQRNHAIMGDGQVFQIFRDNGYQINIIHEIDYFLTKNCHGDTCSFSSELKKISLKTLVISIATFLFLPDDYANKNLFWDPRYIDDSLKNTFTQDLFSYLSRPKDLQQYFSYIHFFSNPGHSSSEFSQANPCDEKRETALYRARVNRAFKFIHQVTEKIISNDPDSIIIFAGDHGPYIFQHCTANEIADDKKSVDERQGAFLAIYWGRDYQNQYDSEIKTSQNLFRYVLSYLSQDDILIRHKPNDYTFVQRSSIFGKPFKRLL